MGVSQQLAAPTYPKINEYNKMEARERVRERPLTQELTGGGEVRVVTPPLWQTDIWVLLLNSSHQRLSQVITRHGAFNLPCHSNLHRGVGSELIMCWPKLACTRHWVDSTPPDTRLLSASSTREDFDWEPTAHSALDRDKGTQVPLYSVGTSWAAATDNARSGNILSEMGFWLLDISKVLLQNF